ncbi:MAG TPA: right-handed parallel beta-helix repeat-containing protein [Thermoanaerobaculia bacterium]|nr:right-handed parallel beta-helix repeat-containing protein [Thermoanaerobaculia bacterium]
MSGPPAAFLSYVHFDDKHEEGRITEFCKRLKGEIRVHTGLEDFTIFQDRDIRWGKQWQARIDSTLDATTFFIPILTPLFFRSKDCRGELTKFLDRELTLHRQDLILPVYYVESLALSDPTKLALDPLAQILAAREYVDWRELRLEPWTDPRLGKMLASMAVQVRDMLEESDDAGSAVQEKPARSSTAARRSGQPAAATEAGRGPTSKVEPPTHIVDPFHRGDFTTISAAIAAAKAGDRILVRPGLYEEGLVIEQPLEIVGDGPLEEIVVRASNQHVIVFRATMGRVTNLTLRQYGDEVWHGVEISQGRLELEGCDITSQNNSCVGIHNGADPRLRRNRIHGGEEGGVFIYRSAQGTMEDNEIFASGGSGVEISSGASPTLRRNRIYDGKSAGVFVHHRGQGTLEDNEIIGNAAAGVEISDGGNPTLRRNRITANGSFAIQVDADGGGTFLDNDLRGNPHGAWDIAKGCDKVIRNGNLTE